MRTMLFLLFLFTFLPTATATAQDATEPEPTLELKTNRDKVSYAIGLNIGRQFKNQGIDVDPKLVAEGIAAIMKDLKPALTAEEIEAAFNGFQAETAQGAKEAAKKFLIANANKENVRKTKTGLQYMVLREGTGKTPTIEDRVSAHYRGKLISGKVFDGSYEGDAPTADETPVPFGVSEVIAGWTEALQLMKVGGKYRLFIPPELAYGEQAPPVIGPNQLLIFDIELMAVLPPSKP